MKIFNIGITFLFIHFVFAEKGCTIEGNYNDNNIMKKVNIKCINDKEYCEEIYPKLQDSHTYDKNDMMYNCNGHFYFGKDENIKDIKECYNKKTGEIVDYNLINLIDRLTGKVECRNVKEHLIKCEADNVSNGFDITDIIKNNEFKCDYKYTGELKSKYQQCLEDNKGQGNGLGEFKPKDYCCRKYLVGTVYRSEADCFWN